MMGNSFMVAYTKLSPNYSGQRTMAIDRITPHCVVLSKNCDKTTYPRRNIIPAVLRKAT